MPIRLLRFSALAVLLALTYGMLVAVPQEAIEVQRSPLTTSPADVGLAFENFSVHPQDRPELTLAGWWMPAEQARATLVFIHGGGSNRNSRYFQSLEFYRDMVKQGVNVAVIDLRNHGLSDSDGVGIQFGRTEQHDAVAAINWAQHKAPGLPLFAMGISMGGATVIQAAAAGAQVDGLILLDSLLDSYDTFRQGAWVETGLPPALFSAAAWSAVTFFGLPGGQEQPLELALQLTLPLLIIQDPSDPVTRAPFSVELAQRNPNAQLWLAPDIPAQHPDLAWKGRWGTHVSAYQFFPDEVTKRILAFING